jgi:hypothetical protein
VPSTIALRSTTILVSWPTVIGGIGKRNGSKRGSPNAASCAFRMVMFFGTSAIGATPNIRRSCAGSTLEPQENTPTVSRRDHSMSFSAAISMADFPVVPLEQET